MKKKSRKKSSIESNSSSSTSSSTSNISNSAINVLIGYCQISYYKDSYCFLSEYLFHSVYDSKSLDSFDLKQYLFNTLLASRNSSEEKQQEQEDFLRANDANQLNRTILKNFQSSPFLDYYLKYKAQVKSAQLAFSYDYKQLDDRLTRAFIILKLPNDWTLLGQNCYLDKGLVFIIIF